MLFQNPCTRLDTEERGPSITILLSMDINSKSHRRINSADRSLGGAIWDQKLVRKLKVESERPTIYNKVINLNEK